MIIVEFSKIKAWKDLSWTGAWAFAHCAREYCRDRIGAEDEVWGVYRDDNESRGYAATGMERAFLPAKLWFKNNEDAVIFKLGFVNNAS